ncbi:MAG: secondary thiamine-phosphate synthase enzyme YjbQ [Mariprofundaceae bacterium]
MRLLYHELVVETRGRGFHRLDGRIHAWLRDIGPVSGLLNLFVRHTSCSLIVQENADPDVLEDLETFFARLVPDGDPAWRHRAEGPDDMPAHIRMALTQVSLNVPVESGRLALGVWQGIYLYEHRTHAMRRRIRMHLIAQADDRPGKM